MIRNLKFSLTIKNFTESFDKTPDGIWSWEEQTLRGDILQ
jgi:hypothetical protein